MNQAEQGEARQGRSYTTASGIEIQPGAPLSEDDADLVVGILYACLSIMPRPTPANREASLRLIDAALEAWGWRGIKAVWDDGPGPFDAPDWIPYSLHLDNPRREGSEN